MSRINNPPQPMSLEPQIDEDKVRRALGLKTNGTTHQQRPEQARQRHRFVADGAVPVVMLNRADSETTGLKERIAALENTLENERAAHSGTRRTLGELQSAYQALQTRLGHTELSHGEALKAEREGRRTAEEAVAALRAERATPRRSAKPAVRPSAEELDAPEPLHAEPVTVQIDEPEPPAVAKTPRQARKARAPSIKEAKPVRWWTPSFRAKKA